MPLQRPLAPARKTRRPAPDLDPAEDPPLAVIAADGVGLGGSARINGPTFDHRALAVTRSADPVAQQSSAFMSGA